MELSRSRGYGGQGVKPTHDFLSLYSPVQQDLTPTIPGGSLKTHDFLQPLEQAGKEGVYIEKSKSLPPSSPTMIEHILPRGMGTYSISHITYINQIQCQQVLKPKEGSVISAAQSSSSNNNDENSNCSSYTGNGFTPSEESNVNKGKTRKENNITGSMHMREDAKKIGMPSQSASIYNHPSTTTLSSLSCSRPSSAPINRHFVDTVKFGKNVHEEEDCDEEFVIKKEPSFRHKGGISVKIDTTKHDPKSNSPRSKHSATEQRRRSKINDRFSVLREMIPRGDQKRDKASFLLEVIEYIQFLQEKVHKYEDSPQRPNNTSTIPTNTQNLLDSNISQQPQSTNNPSALATDTETTASQLSYSKSCISDEIVASYKLKDEEAIIESGTISISSIYSQGLSSALTQALKSSGVDLSHANISVQIDLGKMSNTHTFTSPRLDLKENETTIDQTVARSRFASTREEESGEGFKRLKPNRK